ncbi:hypothetical protein BJX65DRAFT_265942 [Aspergillus insuetus]
MWNRWATSCCTIRANEGRIDVVHHRRYSDTEESLRKSPFEKAEKAIPGSWTLKELDTIFDLKGHVWQTPVMLAAKTGHSDVVEPLLRRSTDQ